MVGDTVSHYRIIAEIGAGGMGVVYKAEDLRLGRLVALKFLPPQLVRDANAKRRFFQEARTASSIDHVNVCTIHDIEETTDGRVFISMAYCDGETLKKRLERGPLAATEAVRVALQVARGLARAHQVGIVHRDVKPGNIMVTTEGEAKLLDFGIAKITSGGDLTRTGTTLGTIAYMAPEHVRGGGADERSDVWALGVVLYEMLAGRRPFSGADDYELLQGIVDRAPAPLTGVAGVTDDIARVVGRALDKVRERRYANAGELVHALDACVQTSDSEGSTRSIARRRPWAMAALAGAVVLVAAVAALWMWRSSGTRWARGVALPEILRLADLDRNGEAFLLATQAETRIAGDPVLNGLWLRISRQVSLTTTPVGADVSFRLIGGDSAWHAVGRTPLVNTRLPRGVFWWRFQKAEHEPIEVVRATDFTELLPGLDAVVALRTPGSGLPGMVPVSVPPSGIRLTLTDFQSYRRVPAPDYYIDRHEVTNAEFKAFVDAAGYEKREYWTEPFVRDGQTLDWTAAMTVFRDGTGRPGPASWQGGTYPAGEEDWPVTAVSWYEAAAYAAFRGKHLPTIYHWTHAARPELGNAITRSSHFGGGRPVRVGTAPGLGPYGTVDMAGNVKEWVWNEQAGAGKRYILGGASNDPDYQFTHSDSRSPFDRSDTNGFRCVAYGVGAAPPDSLAAPVAPQARDYTTERPVADAAYRIYADQYSYDRTPFDDRVESTDDTSPHWRHEVVSMATVYGSERMPVHLYLPKNVKPPYQAVLFFPGGLAIGAPNSTDLQLNTFAIDFIILSGRALVYPVYKYTYGRSDPRVASAVPQTRAHTTWVQQLVNDARRALDYVETRPDIDASRLAYYGLSWGGFIGPIPIALDPRIKAGVLLMGGLVSRAPAPEVDPFNFAPRVRIPILMLNGDQDFLFPLQTSQRPLFETLGTPTADKKHVLYPGGHEIFSTQRSQIVQEVVGWLDRYVGRVQ